MNTENMDGKTLYFEEGGKRHYGPISFNGAVVTVRWTTVSDESGSPKEWASRTFKPDEVARFKRNEEGKTINFWGKKTPDYFYFPEPSA
jgi:hypothetical protein